MNKKQLLSAVLVFFVAFYLVANTTRAADNLSGKFFPPDSPILANVYPIDFLPWSILLSACFAFAVVGLIAKYVEKKTFSTGSAIVVIVIYVVFAFIEFKLGKIRFADFQHGDWAHYSSQLIQVGRTTWLVVGFSAIYYFDNYHSKET